MFIIALFASIVESGVDRSVVVKSSIVSLAAVMVIYVGRSVPCIPCVVLFVSGPSVLEVMVVLLTASVSVEDDFDFVWLNFFVVVLMLEVTVALSVLEMVV